MTGAVIPVGVPSSSRNFYVRDPVFSITQTASRLMRATIVAACISGGLLFISGGLRAQQRPAVVELFTSEGCSSCPPAEAYVGELAQRPDVLALSFHVDYWDDLGWRDRFDIPEATPRQRQYAQALSLSSVYTPQIVVDGYEDFVGSDRRKIGRSLSTPRTGIPVSIAVNEGKVIVDLATAVGGPRGDVVLVAYQQSAISSIGRGENSGRTLTEYHIVRAVRHLGYYNGDAKQYATEIGSLPKDATHVAVLVQLPGQGRVVAASSHALR